MIMNGVNGFLVPPNDVKKLADGIVAVLKDENMHRHLVKNAPLTNEKNSAMRLLLTIGDC